MINVIGMINRWSFKAWTFPALIFAVDSDSGLTISGQEVSSHQLSECALCLLNMSYSLCSYLLPHQLIIWYGRITKVHKPWKTAEVILSSTSTTWIIQRLYFLWHIRCLVFWRCRCQPQCVCNFRLIFSLKKSGQIQSDYTRRCITCTEVLKDPARCRSYTPPKKNERKLL